MGAELSDYCLITLSAYSTNHTDSRHTLYPTVHTGCYKPDTSYAYKFALAHKCELENASMQSQYQSQYKTECTAKHMYTHCTIHKLDALTVLGRFCLRKLFMSPPVMSSRRINLGRI